MFERLSDRFEAAFSKLKSRGRLDDRIIDEVLRDIRAALLEADVNVVVARHFVERVRQRVSGQALQASLTPAQQVIKAVRDELVETLGGETFQVRYAPHPPTIILMVGLQGSGKTTAAAKLARWFRHEGRQPLLVAADLQRPAAIQQLKTLGERAGVPVVGPELLERAGVSGSRGAHPESVLGDPVQMASLGVEEAKRLGRNVVIIDTAGRLAIDDALMNEIHNVAKAVKPHYSFLVVDAMVGQDAFPTAQAFHEAVPLDAVVLTKLDGDARGGAALSVKEVVGKPVAFASTGERVEDLEAFHPDRMAERILGMGDVLTLIEKAESHMDKDLAEKAVGNMLRGELTLDDFLNQLRQIRRMGPLSGLLSMMPGVPKEVRQAGVDDRELDRIEAIICSMTPLERAKPSVIDGSRRARIAAGSGTSVSDVNKLLSQFEQMRKMLQSAGLGALGLGRKRGGKKVKGGRVTPKGTKGGVKPRHGGQGDDLLAGLGSLGGMGLPGGLQLPPGLANADPQELEALVRGMGLKDPDSGEERER
jgi:signal recognition particle subunit SRP54